MYTLFIYLHVASTVVSIGPFFILFPLLKRMRSANDAELQQLIPVFGTAVWLSKHTGHVLVFSGVGLLWLSDWTFASSTWVIMTITIMVSSLYFIARAFSPTLRKLKEPNHDRDRLMGVLTRSLYGYVILMMVMLWFMVAKPVWW